MVTEEMNRKIREHNAEFAALGPEAKRVAIARDVLRQLAAEKLVAMSGTFIGASGALLHSIDVIPDDVKMGAILPERCDVCAIGALLKCTIDLANNVTVGELRSEVGGHDYVLMYFENITPFMSNFFDLSQLRLMEIAFEHGEGGVVPETDEEFVAAHIFQRRDNHDNWEIDDTNEHDRLLLIMECLARNNGLFVVSDVSL